MSPSRCQRLPLFLPLFVLDDNPRLDLAIDCADEVGLDLYLVKGHGGTLLHEMMVDAASDKLLVVVDNSKLVSGSAAAASPCW